jgi:hypothetical protein
MILDGRPHLMPKLKLLLFTAGSLMWSTALVLSYRPSHACTPLRGKRPRRKTRDGYGMQNSTSSKYVESRNVTFTWLKNEMVKSDNRHAFPLCARKPRCGLADQPPRPPSGLSKAARYHRVEPPANKRTYSAYLLTFFVTHAP